MWRRARRSREIWAQVAAEAAIAVLHKGLLLPVRRPEAVDLLHAFLKTEMGAECELLELDAVRQRSASCRSPDLLAALVEPA